MNRRTFVFLSGALAVVGCEDPSSRSARGYSPFPATLTPNPGTLAAGRIAILLPLTGPRADVGQSMLRAAQLALGATATPLMEACDTGGTAQGAAAAADAAIARGARLILGPLTSAETAAVAPIARTAGVAVLAFTNDASQSQPGVWALGITPVQQVRRLVAAARAQGKNRPAALLPDTDFGRAMAEAFQQAAASAGLPRPEIQMHAPGMSGVTSGARALSGYAVRRGPVDAQIKAARALGTAEGRRQAAELAKTPIPPPQFNLLLLADTKDDLAGIAAMLPYYDVDRSSVQIIGPTLWAAASSGSGELQGAWYAAPDPAAREAFQQEYQTQFNAVPPAVASIAYDASAIARIVAAQGGYSIRALTQPAGFLLSDGWLALQADGQVRRGLAVFRIERGGPALIEPAPQSPDVAGV